MKKPLIVFIVDDDSEDQEVIVEIIAEIDSSIECNTALNAKDALLVLKGMAANLPDYIFLDLNMPRMNGKECLRILKNTQAFKDIPVIIYSTSSNIKDKEETTILGASYFLTKPSSLDQLKKELETLILNDDKL